jgi:hypothetical protein
MFLTSSVEIEKCFKWFKDETLMMSMFSVSGAHAVNAFDFGK